MMDNKALLDQEILGGNVGTIQARKFQTLNLLRPKYNAKFFEAFPTTWAAAYAFQKQLEIHDQKAVEEWACLFLLHHFGVLHLATFTEPTLRDTYDKDLWPSLRGTYPHLSISRLGLLRTDNGTIVGASYPLIFFFSSRGRQAWSQDPLLNRYVEDELLSWSRCSEYLLPTPETRTLFYRHLLRIPTQGVFSAALSQFCLKNLGPRPHLETTENYNSDPSTWPGAALLDEHVDYRRLLHEYPLKRENGRGGWNYFLIAGMPATSDGWMTTLIRPGFPSPAQYRKPVNSQTVGEIVVEFRGAQVTCPLGPNDEVVMLKDCFIKHPAMCGLAQEATAQKVKTQYHKIAADGRGICSMLPPNDSAAILLAPLNAKFLKYFADIVSAPDRYAVTPTRELPGVDVTWRFMIDGKEVVWQTSPEYFKELSNTSVALWPPKVATNWGVYIAYGSGVRQDLCGRWVLVGAKGVTNDNHTLSADEYVSIMQGAGDRPYALLLRDNDENDGGVLFLEIAEAPVSQPLSARLSVDFGTSNTCLAYDTGAEATALQFSLNPEMLWGPAHTLEAVGFVPFHWGGKDGYFPTVLLSRLNDWKGDINAIKADLKLEHLLRVDIPGLHQKLEKYMFEGGYRGAWSLHDDLKWNSNDTKPWRSLFLGLVLLYAHAELYFERHAKIESYVFTYPLAFDDVERDLYVHDAWQVTNRIRSFCYAGDREIDLSRFYAVDESTAIAKFIEAASNRETLELFVDTGGGTTDIALRYDREFLVLDSIKVAGKAFFQFARLNFKKNLRGGTQFKKHLGSLLQDLEDAELSLDKEWLEQLDTFYSLAINRLDDLTFRRKEKNILSNEKGYDKSSNKGMGAGSFQRYRSRLFFQHTLAYALIQACAAAVNRKLEISNGIRLILGGNAWGLLAFAELPRTNEAIRQEADDILALIKSRLTPTLSEEQRTYLGDSLRIADVRLLNKDHLSEAKTAVARGALTDLEETQRSESLAQTAYSYSGISIRELRVNGSEPFDLLWCDLWGKEGLRQKLGRRIGDIKSFEFEREKQIREANPVLTIFTSVGNTSDGKRDLMPEQEWVNINSVFGAASTYVEKESLKHAPLNHFISDMLYPSKKEHYLLNVLAKANGNYENR